MSVPAPALADSPSDWRDGPPDGRHPHGGCARCRTVPGWFGPTAPDTRPAITSPESAAAVLVPLLAGRDREHCVAALVDTKHRLLGTTVVSIGSIDHTFMAPREVYRDALVANASAVVLAHNHPSGDPDPSADDQAVTRRLAAAGELVGVDLLDHLVVAGDRWVSLARRGVVQSVRTR
jgi:DNA repair protein RadC